MSILNAIRQQGSSIDDLSKLPQAMIMGMAQKKQIPAEMVAPILARKAEMADAVARTKAMQPTGAPPTSVMEQLMQKTAEQEQPAPQAREMGIAQLPVDEGMYDEKRMAGGGIVAFNGTTGSEVESPKREPGESENAYLERVRAVREGLGQLVTPRNYNPLAKVSDLYDIYDRNIGQPFAKAVSRFTDEPLGEQSDRFNRASNARKNISFTDTAPKVETPKTKARQYTKEELDDIARGQGVFPEGSSALPTGIKSLAKKPAENPAEKPADTKPQSPLQKATGAPEMPETKVDPIDALIAKYEKMIQGDPEATKKAKKDAMWARGVEAGLNIMGGTSSNFAQNVALASPAIRGYGEDVKGLRAEETAKLNQLAGLGLKGATLKQEARKLGITEQHYKDWLRVQEKQIAESAASRRDAANVRASEAAEGRASRETIAMDNRIKGLADSLLKLPKYMDNPELAYADAQKMVTGKSAQPTFTGFSGRPL
jgi:hypothetical protein